MTKESKPYWRITANLTGRENWVRDALERFMKELEINEDIEVVERSEIISLNHDKGENFTGMILMVVKAEEEALSSFESPINFISSQLVAVEEAIQQWRQLGWLCCKS